MESLTNKVEALILENASKGKYFSIGEIVKHFSAEGYSANDIRIAFSEFSRKYCSSGDECDT